MKDYSETKTIKLQNGMFQYFLQLYPTDKIKFTSKTFTFDKQIQNNTEKEQQKEKDLNQQKRVKFSLIPSIKTMHVWQYAYTQARKDIWGEKARDNDRFKRRINKIENIILPILTKKKKLCI